MIGADPLTVTISPQYPRPYQTVVVTPASTLIDLAAANVTVRANGTVAGQGSGAIRTNVQMGGPGTRTTIVVTAIDASGKTYTKQLVVSPADVSLIVEPATTVHPFYKGGSLVTSEGQVRLVAIPDLRTSAGTRIPAANLVYTWRFGDQILQAQSGIGKSVLTATAPPRYRDATVSLVVSSQDSSVVARAEVSVAPTTPLIRIYQNDPLLGPLFERALIGSFTMAEEEQTFRAVPYFFSGAPALSWTVGGRASGGDKDITLRTTGGQGTSRLNVSANQPTTRQTAETPLSVEFGNTGGIGIFGL